MMNKYNFLRLFYGLFFFVGGLLVAIFSNYSFMSYLLGYTLGASLILIGLYLIFYVFIKEPEHFFRSFLYILLVGFGVMVIITPNLFVDYLILLIGIEIASIGLLYWIKFIILKKVKLNGWFPILQVVICFLFMGIGITSAVFYRQIGTQLTAILLSIPMMIFGLYNIVITMIRIIKNR